MSNLKIGGSSAGLFIGDKQILGGVENLLNEITIAPDFEAGSTTSTLVANLSSKELTLTRNGDVTTIPKQHIEWYSYSGNADIKIQSNEDVYALMIACLAGTTSYQKITGTKLMDVVVPMNVGFYMAFIIFDKI